MAEEIARRVETQPDDAAIAKAHAIYTPFMLRLYDVLVHGLSNRFAWRGITPNRAASALLDLYNTKGIFNNREDDLTALSAGLRQRFDDVEIRQEGCVALFRAA
jgi:hypothetical protein